MDKQEKDDLLEYGSKKLVMIKDGRFIEHYIIYTSTCDRCKSVRRDLEMLSAIYPNPFVYEDRGIPNVCDCCRLSKPLVRL